MANCRRAGRRRPSSATSPPWPGGPGGRAAARGVVVMLIGVEDATCVTPVRAAPRATLCGWSRHPISSLHRRLRGDHRHPWAERAVDDRTGAGTGTRRRTPQRPRQRARDAAGDRRRRTRRRRDRGAVGGAVHHREDRRRALPRLSRRAGDPSSQGRRTARGNGAALPRSHARQARGGLPRGAHQPQDHRVLRRRAPPVRRAGRRREACPCR